MKKVSKKKHSAPVYEAQALKTEFVVQILKQLEKQNISQSELARRINIGRASIHRLLRVHNTSHNLNTLAKILCALKCEVKIRFIPVEQ